MIFGERRLGMLAEKIAESQRLAAEIQPYGLFGMTPVVALAEEKINRAMNGIEARGDVVVTFELEECLRLREISLGALKPFLDRRRRAQKGMGDLTSPEALQDVQNQRNLSFFRDLRMTTGEHHPQLVVADSSFTQKLGDQRHQRPLALELTAQVRRKFSRSAFSA